MTLSQEQLNAACDEAKKLGLRTIVHAYKDAVRAATLAGCTQIEHGTMATDDDLKLMAAKGTYLDPQAGLVIEDMEDPHSGAMRPLRRRSNPRSHRRRCAGTRRTSVASKSAR